ncbi:hypothetical protein HYV88_02855 [Candidatus Woesearchaeota archaeon]|nr:hypothetical protein [Candidatus Woesearchaeota archaeon]
MKCEYCSSKAVFKLVSIGVDEEDFEKYVCDNEACNLELGFVYNGIRGIKTFDYKERLVDMESN